MKKQKRKKLKTHISPRLNILFLCVFLLFSAIIVKLGKVQIVDGDLFGSVLGNITNSEEGLPKEHLDSYLVHGYNRNDRVGKIYIEQRYEDVLHGTKGEVRNHTDKAGNIIQTETVSKGKSGNNLTSTIDMELQKKVEESIEKNLKAFQGSEPLMDRAFVVMMNPKTGGILSMAGKKFVEKDGKRFYF